MQCGSRWAPVARWALAQVCLHAMPTGPAQGCSWHMAAGVLFRWALLPACCSPGVLRMTSYCHFPAKTATSARTLLKPPLLSSVMGDMASSSCTSSMGEADPSSSPTCGGRAAAWGGSGHSAPHRPMHTQIGRGQHTWYGPSRPVSAPLGSCAAWDLLCSRSIFSRLRDSELWALEPSAEWPRARLLEPAELEQLSGRT